MKGLLTWHDRPFRKTHNLVEVGGAVAELSPAIEPLLRRAAALTEYAFRFRYPGDPDEPDPGEASLALDLAREVFSTLLALLPPDIR
jgi:hypothetical protein